MGVYKTVKHFLMLELVLFLCKLRLGLLLVGSELFKGFRFCHFS